MDRLSRSKSAGKVPPGLALLHDLVGEVGSARQYASRCRDFLVWCYLRGLSLDLVERTDLDAYLHDREQAGYRDMRQVGQLVWAAIQRLRSEFPRCVECGEELDVTGDRGAWRKYCDDHVPYARATT